MEGVSGVGERQLPKRGHQWPGAQTSRLEAVLWAVAVLGSLTCGLLILQLPEGAAWLSPSREEGWGGHGVLEKGPLVHS